MLYEESKITRLVRATTAVAEAPPAKPGKYVSDAKVPWARITELRAALTACGIPWEPGT